MTVTTLDPRTALIIIDLQRGLVGLPLAHPVTDVIERSVALAEAFRARGLPVVLVNVDGQPAGRTEQGSRSIAGFADGWTELIPELALRPDDLLITKRTRGAFTNTGLEERLRERGVTQVVLAGIATSAGVESTARDAHERGFHVALAVDAMTDRDPETHQQSIARVFPRIGETGTTEEILGLLPAG